VFTVIALSPWALERFDRWRELFDPFVTDNSIAFCDWNINEKSHVLSQSVPELKSTIKGKEDWRLVVVGTGSEGETGQEGSTPENPFDFYDNLLAEATGRKPQHLNLSDSIHPVIRLTHMVMGYPVMGAKSFEADPSFRRQDSTGRIHQSEYLAALQEQGMDHEAAKKYFEIRLANQREVRMHFRELEYSPDEKETHRLLSNQYAATQELPKEVILIAPREPITASPREMMQKSWELDIDSIASRFVERNDYPSSCRFAVFDLETEDHAASELGEFKFWLTVLATVSNELPASSFQAERLHRLKVKLNKPRLALMLNEHLSILEGVRGKLELLIRRSKIHAVSEISEILNPQPVVVSFDQLDGDGLWVNTSGYGLASDTPNNESAIWAESLTSLELEATRFARKPKRVLTRAVGESKTRQRSMTVPDKRLDSIERDELEQELSIRVASLARPVTTDILNKVRLHKTIEEGKKKVQEVLTERMTRATIIGASSLVFFAWFVGLFPYLISAWNAGQDSFIDSIAVSAVILGILALTCVIALKVMRWMLVSQLKSVNSDLKSYVNSVKSGAKDFGEYLTKLNTYMYGRAVLAKDLDLIEVEKKRELQFTLMKTRIISKMEAEKEIVRSLDKEVLIQRGIEVEGDFSRGQSAALKSLFLLPRSHSYMGFNESGEKLEAPYEFVTHLQVEALSLYENDQQKLPVSGSVKDPIVDQGMNAP